MAAFCSKCGTQLEGNERFCVKCGNDVTAAAPASAPAPVAAAPPPRVAQPMAPPPVGMLRLLRKAMEPLLRKAMERLLLRAMERRARFR
jgi:predicted amidophosphoribosyltransferase